jgi:hypothetical protein
MDILKKYAKRAMVAMEVGSETNPVCKKTNVW